MYGFDDYDLFIEEYSIEDVREDLGNIVNYFRSQDYHEHAMKLFLEDFRGFSKDAEKMFDAFCVDEEIPLGALPEWMQSESLGFVRGKNIVMEGRCVFPVKDVLGQVMGFIGWDPFAQPKYRDSKNYGYKAKQTTLFGMENLSEYYNNKKPIFVPEGPMCSMYLRQKGFCSLSTLGSYMTPYVIQILNRFGSRLVMIPDNDETGDKFVKQCKYKLPKARVIQLAKGKDVDGCRKIDDGIYENQLLTDLRLLDNPFGKTSNLIIKR